MNPLRNSGYYAATSALTKRGPPTQCIYAFLTTLTINSGYFLTQDQDPNFNNGKTAVALALSSESLYIIQIRQST